MDQTKITKLLRLIKLLTGNVSRTIDQMAREIGITPRLHRHHPGGRFRGEQALRERVRHGQGGPGAERFQSAYLIGRSIR